MESSEKQLKLWKTIAIIAIIALLAVTVLCAVRPGNKQTGTAEADSSKALSLWNDGTGAKQNLIDYVDAVTTEDGEDFIPAEDRIAVFDMDGTLACETFYTYYDIP